MGATFREPPLPCEHLGETFPQKRFAIFVFQRLCFYDGRRSGDDLPGLCFGEFRRFRWFDEHCNSSASAVRWWPRCDLDFYDRSEFAAAAHGLHGGHRTGVVSSHRGRGHRIFVRGKSHARGQHVSGRERSISVAVGNALHSRLLAPYRRHPGDEWLRYFRVGEGEIHDHGTRPAWERDRRCEGRHFRRNAERGPRAGSVFFVPAQWDYFIGNHVPQILKIQTSSPACWSAASLGDWAGSARVVRPSGVRSRSSCQRFDRGKFSRAW